MMPAAISAPTSQNSHARPPPGELLGCGVEVGDGVGPGSDVADGEGVGVGVGVAVGVVAEAALTQLAVVGR